MRRARQAQIASNRAGQDTGPWRAVSASERSRAVSNYAVWFEHVGEYFDDVLVTLKCNRRAAKAIRALPRWAGHWDAASRVWRIHPGYADRLADDLLGLGYSVAVTEVSSKGSGDGQWVRPVDYSASV